MGLCGVCLLKSAPPFLPHLFLGFLCPPSSHLSLFCPLVALHLLWFCGFCSIKISLNFWIQPLCEPVTLLFLELPSTFLYWWSDKMINRACRCFCHRNPISNYTLFQIISPLFINLLWASPLKAKRQNKTNSMASVFWRDWGGSTKYHLHYNSFTASIEREQKGKTAWGRSLFTHPSASQHCQPIIRDE